MISQQDPKCLCVVYMWLLFWYMFAGQLCEIDLINLQNWNMVFNSSTTDLLTLRGEDEVKALGKHHVTMVCGIWGRLLETHFSFFE